MLRCSIKLGIVQSDGQEFNYAEEFKKLDLNAVMKDLMLDDRFAGLVAGRLWPLWAAVHSHGVA